MTKTHCVTGWVIINTDDLHVAEIQRKCCNNFLKAFFATQSAHRSDKNTVVDGGGNIAYKYSVAFMYRGNYAECACFRDALVAFTSLYCLTLDRGLDIRLLKNPVR